MIFDIRKLTLVVVSFTLLSWVSTAQAAMVAYYDFEDNGAGTTTDNVGGYVGTLEGDAVIGAGKYGSGVTLDGSGDYVDGTNQASFEVAQGTIMAWVNPSTNFTSGESQIAGMPGSNSWVAPHHGIQQWYHPSSNRLGTQANDNGAGGQTINGVAPAEGEWHHVAATNDGQILRIFLGGFQTGAVKDFGASSGATYSNSPHLSIGTRNASDPGNFFYGMIDEVKLFDTALSAAEIQAQMVPEPVGLVMVLATLASLALTRFNRS